MLLKIKKYTLDQWLRAGIYLFIFLLPWQTHWLAKSLTIENKFWESGSIRIYATQILLWILIAVFIADKLKFIVGTFIQKKLTSQEVLRHWWWVILALWMASMMLGVYSSLNTGVSLNLWYQFLGGLGLLLLLEKIGIDRIKFVWSFVAGVLLSSILGIYQFFTQSSFAFKWLGLAWHDPFAAGTSVVEYGLFRWLRAYGSFNHPNILGGFIVVALFLSLWLWANAKDKKSDLLALGSFVILTVGLFFTFSRQAWLIFLVSLIIISLIVFLKKSWRENYGWIFGKAWVLVIIIAVGLSIPYWPLVKTRFVATERLELQSIQQREQGYKDSWNLIKQHPFNGTGLGTYSLNLANDMKKNNQKVLWMPEPVHNVYLLSIAEVGASTAILYFLVILQTAVVVWQRYKLQKNLWSITLGVLFLVILAIGLLDHYTWSIYPGIMLWWVVMALVYSNSVDKEN